VTVSRYTPQAVLVANVEEARYEVLCAEDGKLLVRARYAVRNNQRAFLALKLPPQSVLWSAVLAGRPVRPGLAADGAYLLPLQKGRPGENAPTFAVDLFSLQRSSAWSAKGDARVELPAVDLPVSRTGLLVHHSPRFDVEPKPGAFRPSVRALERRVARRSQRLPCGHRRLRRDASRGRGSLQSLMGDSGKTWAGPPPASSYR
jgi:hypothetical protein